MLQRFDDWPKRLTAFVCERRSQPYAYGTNDCCTMIRDAVVAMTGTDLMPGLKPPASRIAGARFLLAGGYGDVEGLATRLLGAPLATPRLARRGDVVSFWADGAPHLALVESVAAVTPTDQGLVWVPRDIWRLGWRVG